MIDGFSSDPWIRDAPLPRRTSADPTISPIWSPTVLSLATPQPFEGSSRDAVPGDRDRPNGGHALWLGRTAYRPTWELQRKLQKGRIAESLPDLLLLTEHGPTYTIGRSGHAEHLLWDDAERASRGIEFVEVDRGGDITYHGPGQLVGYPIVHLARVGRDVHEYMRRLEQVLIDVLGELGIEGGRRPGLTGVWVGSEKVAALGVRISRWVAMHGFALNVAPDLSHFGGIVPCGIQDGSVTSIERLLGRAIHLAEVIPTVVRSFESAFGLELPYESAGQAWLDNELRKLEG